jgi:hypothetical protein
MAKTTTKTDNAAAGYFAAIQNAFETLQSKIEVPAAARDYVKRGASTAQAQAETAHRGAAKFTDGTEKFATSFVGGYANFTRSLLDMTLANVQHTLVTVEKIAGAESLNEAVQQQADFVRESLNANVERARNAADAAKSAFIDSAKPVQAELSNIYSFGQKAA